MDHVHLVATPNDVLKRRDVEVINNDVLMGLVWMLPHKDARGRTYRVRELMGMYVPHGAPSAVMMDCVWYHLRHVLHPSNLWTALAPPHLHVLMELV